MPTGIPNPTRSKRMTQAGLTNILAILDRSGSMSNIQDDMNGGIKELLKEQRKAPGKLRVDVTTFDTIVETPYEGVKAKKIVHPLIHPRGGTALLDAVGQSVRKLDQRIAAT